MQLIEEPIVIIKNPQKVILSNTWWARAGNKKFIIPQSSASAGNNYKVNS